MTTQRQIRKLLAPLAKRHRDLVIHRYLLVLKPVRHILRAVVLEPSSSADLFYPKWLVMSLTTPPKQLPLRSEKRIYHAGPAEWRWSDEAMPAALFEELETSVLPFLRGIETFEDLLGLVPDRNPERIGIDPVMLRELAVHAARGDTAEAKHICQLIAKYPANWPADHWDGYYEAVLQPICEHLSRNDFPGLVERFHEWEALTVTALMIEELWEPTPFPLESAGIEDG